MEIQDLCSACVDESSRRAHALDRYGLIAADHLKVDHRTVTVPAQAACIQNV
jgi:hypothetical protein